MNEAAYAQAWDKFLRNVRERMAVFDTLPQPSADLRFASLIGNLGIYNVAGSTEPQPTGQAL